VVSPLMMFQSTRPRGARPVPLLFHTRKNVFQSTRPRGARRTSEAYATIRLGFNPRAHAGRDAEPRLYRDRSTVSIHAPTRGATA